MSEFDREYYAKNRDRILARRKELYAANPEPRIAAVKRWQERNPDKMRAKERARYAANTEELRRKSREYQQANKEAINLKKKAYRKANADRLIREKRLAYNAKSSAERRTYYQKNRDSILAKQKAVDAANPNRQRNNRLRHKYGITIQQWDSLLEAQGHVCACCGSHDPKTKHGWHTDHDFRSGDIRGILCRRCNHLLGFLGDEAPAMEEMFKLLRRYLRDGAKLTRKRLGL